MSQWKSVVETWEGVLSKWDALSVGIANAIKTPITPQSSVHTVNPLETVAVARVEPIVPYLETKDPLSSAPDNSLFDNSVSVEVLLEDETVFQEADEDPLKKTDPQDTEIVFLEDGEQKDNQEENAEVPSGWEFLFENTIEEPQVSAEPALKLVGEFNMSEALGQEIIKEEIAADILPIVLEELEDLLPIVEDLLPQIDTISSADLDRLQRALHTVKGSIGQVGAKRARAVVHHMETVIEEIEAGMHEPKVKKDELLELLKTFNDLIKPLQNGDWAKSGDMQLVESADDIQQMPKTVRIGTEIIDKMVGDVNEGRLLALSMSEQVSRVKGKLKELDENSQKMSRMLRDFDLQAEMQIQSRKSQLQETGEDFDPLEFDQYTRLQELSRLMVEGMSDIYEDRKDLSRLISDYETLSAQQYRLIQSSQEELHKTRLLPADAINDRLHNDVRNTAKEVGKEVAFEMIGSRVELDRVFLEKIKGPLGHIIKNSIVHGIESAADRKVLNKPEHGTISVRFRQTSGRVIIEVADDGYGLRVDKIREKAIQKGLWNPSENMNSAQAADMICAPNFSTADQVSELAGRGVGMDAVRKEILELGGRFEIKSVETQGMTITIQLPSSVASASVLVVEAGKENWAIPVELVEHVVLVPRADLMQSMKTGVLNGAPIAQWNGTPFKVLDTNVSSGTNSSSAPVLLVKERGQLMALEVSKLVQIFEVPLRTSGTIWGNVKGIAGTVILPNGDAIFLLDPFQFTQQTREILNEKDSSAGSQMPLVMVVDDSLTVRKATTRFLNKSGYQSVVAKDGQEALEVLNRVRPAIILMDIEMPKMDGFDCAKNIKQNSALSDIPIVMITSRTADKHRQHAAEVGVNEYLGKPFKETELLGILQKYAPR